MVIYQQQAKPSRLFLLGFRTTRDPFTTFVDFVHKGTRLIIPQILPVEKVFVHFSKAELDPIFERYSNFTPLQRIIAYILRFTHNSKKESNTFCGNLQLIELSKSLNSILKCVQQSFFPEEIKCLISKLLITFTLISLSLFLD